MERVSHAEGCRLLARMRPQSTAKRFDYADMLEQQLRAMRLPMPTREFQPFADRKYRLDLAWVDRLFFVEADGGEFLKASARRHGGAHDCERWNRLTLEGWAGLRFVGSQIRSGHAIRILETVLKG